MRPHASRRGPGAPSRVPGTGTCGMIGHCRTGEHSSPVRHPHPRPTSPTSSTQPASSNRHTTLEKALRTPAPGRAAPVPTGAGTRAGFKNRPVHAACICAGREGVLTHSFQWYSRGSHSPEPFQPAGSSWKIAGQGVPTPWPAEQGTCFVRGLQGVVPLSPLSRRGRSALQVAGLPAPAGPADQTPRFKSAKLGSDGVVLERPTLRPICRTVGPSPYSMVQDRISRRIASCRTDRGLSYLTPPPLSDRRRYSAGVSSELQACGLAAWTRTDAGACRRTTGVVGWKTAVVPPFSGVCWRVPGAWSCRGGFRVCARLWLCWCQRGCWLLCGWPAWRRLRRWLGWWERCSRRLVWWFRSWRSSVLLQARPSGGCAAARRPWAVMPMGLLWARVRRSPGRLRPARPGAVEDRRM